MVHKVENYRKINMFEKFLDFVGCQENEKISGMKEFCELLNGKSFLNGMYRLFKTDDIEKWTAITEQAFPLYKGRFSVFGYDWLGRIFALNKKTGTVLLFEPGTGEVLDIPASFEDFHNVEIADYNEDSLASDFFKKWFFQNNKYELKNSECAGYKVPLFLNGDDVIENLEVSDMEVYWEIMMPLMNM